MEENGVLWRLRHLEEETRRLDDKKADTKDLDNVAEQMRSLSTDFTSLRRAIITFSFTIAASAIVFAFAVLQLLGK